MKSIDQSIRQKHDENLLNKVKQKLEFNTEVQLTKKKTVLFWPSMASAFLSIIILVIAIAFYLDTQFPKSGIDTNLTPAQSYLDDINGVIDYIDSPISTMIFIEGELTKISIYYAVYDDGDSYVNLLLFDIVSSNEIMLTISIKSNGETVLSYNHSYNNQSTRFYYVIFSEDDIKVQIDIDDESQIQEFNLDLFNEYLNNI
ncbi:hypothetical protein JV173_02185 [Acholeplasma equirhinis]|uniref:hypothetical protein n=1 Tax=Acholeplasma equirhinis TaxID=555393 RepID=UPI00197AC0A1|nr:hypothetical protein [Acholeplasma equirhinis]MBN3490315.1 hypothetical protein [Acholeplasma equirhinis]